MKEEISALDKNETLEKCDLSKCALDKNETWEKCDLSKGKKTVGCRWVYSIKYLADGTIERHKARPFTTKIVAPTYA